MKKTIYILAIAATASLAACKGKKTDMDANKEMVLLTDSSYNSSYLTDTGAVANTEEFTNGDVVSGKATVDGKANAPRSNSGSGGGGTASSGSSSSQGTGSTASTGTGQTSTAKKGISKAAKGAIIGGVGGAVTGAVISKNKGKGAIIGGVVGAAGGYIIGRSQDKKDGRVGN
ncbi:MAG: YMGG-like glycine zipper-containing protein [Ferruginibacter sp.]